MSEQSKFSGALAKLNQRPAEQADEQGPMQLNPASIQSAPQNEPGRGKGRPPGKRSDPAYQPTTVLLRKQTKRAANRQLEDRATGQDLSHLLMCRILSNLGDPSLSAHIGVYAYIIYMHIRRCVRPALNHVSDTQSVPTSNYGPASESDHCGGVLSEE